MSKQKLSLLLFLMMPLCFLMAQKVKTEKLKVAFTQLPSQPLDPEFTTYSVLVHGASSSIEDVGLTRSGLADGYFKLNSFKKVPEGGHFRVTASVGYLRIGSSKNERYTKEEKKGDETVKRTYYKRKITYKLPVSYRVEDYRGDVIAEGTLGNDYVSTEWGSGYSSSSALSEAWSKARAKTYDGWRKKLVPDHLKTIGGSIRSKHDFQPRTRNVEFEVLKPKSKGADADAYMKAFETVKATFAKMRTNEPVDGLKEGVKPAIDFWLGEKDKYSASDKKLSKVRHICLYNAALTFYWLDELDEARKYANECMEIKWKDGRPKRILNNVESVKKLFATNKMTTRHPNIDLSDAKPPARSAFGAIQEVSEGGASETNLKGYMVNENGDKMEGDFSITAGEGEELKFGPEGNVCFTYVKEGRKAKNFLEPEKTQKFSFNDRTFVVQNFTAGAKGNTEEKLAVLEVLYTADNISVYKYFPYDDKLGDQKVEYAYMKASEEKPVSTSGTMFLLFNKGLAKYFADCADLAEVAGTGEFKKTEDDIIRAARVYGEMCTP